MVITSPKIIGLPAGSSGVLCLAAMTFFLCQQESLAFVVKRISPSLFPFAPNSVQVHPEQSRLWYKDGSGNEGEDHPASHPPTSSSQSFSEEVQEKVTLPVLTPIPGRRPLVMGADMLLDPPTPLQWKTLEASIKAHEEHCFPQDHEEGEEIPSTCAGVDAAPLVAILDEQPHMSIPGMPRGMRYATIAAVVGISETTESKESSSSDDFMTSLAEFGRTSRNSRVRLVGVGRAALYNIVSSEPPATTGIAAETGNNIDTSGDDQDDEDDDEPELMEPILLAEFRVLKDSSQRRVFFGQDCDRSMDSSPVHAVTEMNTLANRLTWLHDERRQLLQGIQAGKSRLQLASERWEDLDGIGSLFYDRAQDEQLQEEINSLLEQFPGKKVVEATKDDAGEDSAKASGVSDAAKKMQFEVFSNNPLVKLDNYGMGTSATSISALPALSNVLLETLEPYYSPERCASEEHYYEALSFVGLWSLHHYLEANELAWALRCTNTIERMDQVYAWMLQHKQQLQSLAQGVSQELRDCGEECTDLW